MCVRACVCVCVYAHACACVCGYRCVCVSKRVCVCFVLFWGVFLFVFVVALEGNILPLGHHDGLLVLETSHSKTIFG